MSRCPAPSAASPAPTTNPAPPRSKLCPSAPPAPTSVFRLDRPPKFKTPPPHHQLAIGPAQTEPLIPSPFTIFSPNLPGFSPPSPSPADSPPFTPSPTSDPPLSTASRPSTSLSLKTLPPRGPRVRPHFSISPKLISS